MEAANALRPQPGAPPVPDDTARVARAAFPRGNLYLLSRERTRLRHRAYSARMPASRTSAPHSACSRRTRGELLHRAAADLVAALRQALARRRVPAGLGLRP